MRTQRGTRPYRVRIKAANDTTLRHPTGVTGQSHSSFAAAFTAGSREASVQVARIE